MRTLKHTLQDFDFGHIRILAEVWGLLSEKDSHESLMTILFQNMLHPDTLEEMVESLTSETRDALDTLISAHGKSPYAAFNHAFGPLREMGPGKRDRTKPWRNAVSPLEELWYTGLLGRAFLDTQSGIEEYIYIPTDLLDLLPKREVNVPTPLGNSIPSPRHQIRARSLVVDDATTLLAALRINPVSSLNDLDTDLDPKWLGFLHHPTASSLLIHLLVENEVLLGSPYEPNPETAQQFLKKSRSESLRFLLLAWQTSLSWNDLHMLSHVTISGGEWPNDPFLTRKNFLELVHPIPIGEWWSLDDFIQDVKLQHPFYLRKHADFDSWYIQDQAEGGLLDGFENWDAVDGQLLRSLLLSVLFWMGVTDIGSKAKGEQPNAFRLTPLAKLLKDPDAPVEIKSPEGSATLSLDGFIRIHRATAFHHRYQISRFTDWIDHTPDQYSYLLTPSSLRRGKEQGMRLEHIKSILGRLSQGEVLESVVAVVERWFRKGVEARIEQPTIIQVDQPEILNQLMANRYSARLIQKQISPTIAIVETRQLEALRKAALRAGILIDIPESTIPPDKLS